MNTLPRITQLVEDTDFEIEAKFESLFTQGFQSQGILIEQDDLNVLRIEFHRVNADFKVFAASIFGGSYRIRVMKKITATQPMYLRVRRDGNLWRVFYSYDDTTWITATTFTQMMTVTRIGVYAGNSADTPHTAVVDYFFNTASPIIPEDPENT